MRTHGRPDGRFVAVEAAATEENATGGGVLGDCTFGRKSPIHSDTFAMSCTCSGGKENAGGKDGGAALPAMRLGAMALGTMSRLVQVARMVTQASRVQLESDLAEHCAALMPLCAALSVLHACTRHFAYLDSPRLA